ncbi:MAG: methyltransferase regulatory domain-containing protein, partial [Aureliella sp.]
MRFLSVMHRQAGANSYDSVPYPTYALPQTHPRRLETIAWLLSLPAPSSQDCRVLELGCGDGSNLIPMAVAAPDCQFVGADASSVQIEMGRQIVKDLRLTNIKLEHRAIEQLDASWGSFDYIVCHGVFSWVPPQVQLAILRLVRELLTAEGIAYISYNTQPGWHGRGAIRNMMGYHVGRFSSDDPLEKIRRARGLLDLLTRATAGNHDSYGLLLRENLAQLSQLPDAYLFHEHLEEINEPIWFLDFCEMLASVDLRYLGEADFSAMIAPAGLSDEIRLELEELAPRLLEKEQYLDFLRNRSFRQTLICRAGRQPNYAVGSERIHGLYVGTQMIPKSLSVDYSADVVQEFELGTETTLSTQLPIFKAALVVLRQAWPSLLPFDRVYHEANELLEQANVQQDRHDSQVALGKAILTTYSSTSQPVIELSRRPVGFATELSNYPLASPLVRLQATCSQIVSNFRHESVRLSEAECFLLTQLDGNRSVDVLVNFFSERFPEAFESSATVGAQTMVSPHHSIEADTNRGRRQILEEYLVRFARNALLVA